MIEKHSDEHGLRCRRITSGAGQDAQNMALVCPTAMIFCPSVDGVSRNPKEFTEEKDIISCTEVFTDVLCELAGAKWCTEMDHKMSE